MANVNIVLTDDMSSLKEAEKDLKARKTKRV